MRAGSRPRSSAPRPYHGACRSQESTTIRCVATQISARLDPQIFRLPVERIREGYYSDAYFVHTKALLEAEGHHPRVTMQVFQKHDSLLGGVDEAIAVLKL